MNRLQDYALYDISWNLSPEHAVTMYLEWGNNDWHSEYPPVRSKEDVSHYFVVDSWGKEPVIRLVRRNSENAEDLFTMPPPAVRIRIRARQVARHQRTHPRHQELAAPRTGPVDSFDVITNLSSSFPPQTHKPPHQTHQTGPRQRGPSSFGGPGYCHAIPARAVARGLFERGGGARWPVRIPARTEEPQRSGRPFASFPGRRT